MLSSRATKSVIWHRSPNFCGRPCVSCHPEAGAFCPPSTWRRSPEDPWPARCSRSKGFRSFWPASRRSTARRRRWPAARFTRSPGKTAPASTLMRIVAGLETADGGTVRFSGRGIAMIHQEPRRLRRLANHLEDLAIADLAVAAKLVTRLSTSPYRPGSTSSRVPTEVPSASRSRRPR